MTRLAALALIAGLLVGCGGAPARTLPNGSPVAVIDQDCADRIEPLYDVLKDLSSRLNVGLSKVQYAERLGDVRVEYDDAIRGGTFPSGACFTTVKKLEDALNEHIAANNRWGDCIASPSCDVDTDALPELRTHWTRASALVEEVALALP